MSDTEPRNLVDALIPCVDVSAGRCTTPTGIPGITDPHDPVELAMNYAAGGARRVFLDIFDPWEWVDDATKLIMQLSGVAVDVLVSMDHGRVPSVESCGRLLDAGAAMVSVNTSVVRDPGTVEDVAARFGAAHVMGTVNARERQPEGWTAHIDGGREPTGIDVPSFGRTLADLGVGLILANCADREGTGRGYDHALVRELAETTGLPVIASGGSRTTDHLWDGITIGGATFVLANKMLHSGAVLMADVSRSRCSQPC